MLAFPRSRVLVMVVLLVSLLGGQAVAQDAGAATPTEPVAAPVPDAGLGAVTFAPDAGVAAALQVDAAPQVDAATPIDAATPDDARPRPTDAATDAGLDAPTDAGLDAPTDAGADTPPDAGTDAGTDAPAATELGPDAGAAGETVAPPAALPPPARPTDAAEKSRVVIKLVIGLMLLFAVAYVGSQRAVVRLQEWLGISGIIAAGFPFVALGVVASQPEVGILTSDVVERMRPLLHFGLGWLGFIIGAQLDIRVLDRVPHGTAYLIVVEALVPFAVTAAACGAVAIALGISDWDDPWFWRDLILLGAAAAMTAPRRFRGFANRGWREGRSVDQLLAQLDEIVGVIGLLFVAAYFRPAGTGGWDMPGTAWLFVTIGLGVVVGVLIFAMVRVPTSSGEFLAVVLGSVALCSGLAGYLQLSPIVVCFIAGALVTNFPCEQRDDIFRILNRLERPIHLLFLIVAGATWEVAVLEPWVIVPVFVVARIAGKWIGVFVARSTVGPTLPRGFADQRVLVSALSPLSIALVVSLHGSAAGDSSGWIVTLVIAGAILTEVAVQLSTPPVSKSDAYMSELPRDIVDELDEPTDGGGGGAGPTYRDDDDPLPPLAPRPRTEGDDS